MFSSCRHLLGSWTKRGAVFLLALTALLGNSFSLLVCHCLAWGRRRRGEREPGRVTSVYELHLNVCNGIMGVYMATLAVAGQLFGEEFWRRERAWRSSAWCAMAGFTFLMSSQVSVFIVATATVERCWVMTRARCSGKCARKVSACNCFLSWTCGAVLACVPAASSWNLFDNSVCMLSVVPLTAGQLVHDYAAGVLVVLNSVLMAVVALGQGYLLFMLRQNDMALIFDAEGSQDLRQAKRLMNVSVTDACTWFLVATVTLLTSRGVWTSGEGGFTITMFAMVTKPSVNPFMYLLNVVREHRKQTLQQRLLQRIRRKVQCA